MAETEEAVMVLFVCFCLKKCRRALKKDLLNFFGRSSRQS